MRANADAEPQVVNTSVRPRRATSDAARALAGLVGSFLIIGGKHSSNSTSCSRLRRAMRESFLIETQDEIDSEKLARRETGRVTAGPSTPKCSSTGGKAPGDFGSRGKRQRCWC